MAAKRKTRAREAQLAFEALAIEGGLLSPEWLSKVAQLQADTQAEADYRVPKGLNLRDEIGRYWRIAQAHWADFKLGREAKADPTATAERFGLALLRDAFGFASLRQVEPAVLAERSYPIGRAALGGRVPVVVAPADTGLDTLASVFGDGVRRRSAFGLAQEYLNAQEGALWGIVSDGVSLRIVRDNASLTRPAWIEADLERIFTEERYADFAALWLLCHETRFGREGQPVTECALEVWRNAGREEGTRAREHLRRGVEDALVALGQGFLSHTENAVLRVELQNGTLSAKDYFNQLLRLVYRLIFLLTVEERGLLHPEGTGETIKALYANGYGIRRLRERSVKRSAHDRFSDLWDATKVVCRGLASGEPRLGLPALAGIFAVNQCPTLDGAKLENRALLLAVFKLAWLRENGGLSRVNWRDMGPEELGSVYESLLELVPQIAKDGRQFAFATGGETKGNARKTTGSYYTPDSLVQVLLDSALEPVIADTIAKHPGKVVEALLGLSIVDPACGSGHFLLAAARRLAAHVARLQANGTPSAAEYRHALRQVVGRCIFGVDLNPMAVELCKVGLWMEAVEPGLPLTFLNSHIQHGNALLGTTPELMAKGIPDAAWDPIEGDDKKAASALKKRNKLHAVKEQQGFNFLLDKTIAEAVVEREVVALDAESDETLAAVQHKEDHWEGIVGSSAYRHQKLRADAWCAAFVWPKQPGEMSDLAPTNEVWRDLDGDEQLSLSQAAMVKVVRKLAEQYCFFHWHLQFPQVFSKGGFDVVLGNPPWEALRLIEKEFFAASAPEIAEAENSAERKTLIDGLAQSNPDLYRAFVDTLRTVEGFNAFVIGSGGYPLCGVGRVNLFALFAERARASASPRARIGQILPAGLVSDDSTKFFFQALVAGRELAAVLHFENEDKIFPAVHHAFKFVLLVVDRTGNTQSAVLQFFSRSPADLLLQERRFTLSADDLALVNPSSKTCPIFRTRRDATLTMQIYRRCKTVVDSDWQLSPRFPLDVGRASGEFRKRTGPDEDLSPLYEGKYFHQFDHRWLTHDGDDDRALTDAERIDPSMGIQPRYLFPTESIVARYESVWPHPWILCWRDIARSTDERTVIASVVPSLAVAHTAWLLMPAPEQVPLVSSVLAMLNSFAFDFIARQKVGGTHLNKFVFEQLPLVSRSLFSVSSPFLGTTLHEWIHPRVLELTYTEWALEPFAREVGYAGTPFRWAPDRRFQLRCELDAAFFHLYGLARDDVDYVMDSFPVVRKNDEKAHGEYRTKRVILETYDALAKSIQTGKPYRTPLDPLPAASGASHGVFASDGTPKDYAEALRMGLLFTLIRRSGDAGISQGTLSRALLWLEDAKHAATGLQGAALADFERVRESDPLLAQGASDAPKLLQALENEKAITRDAKGLVRLRAGSTIPNWLPQTPTLAKLASLMRAGLKQAEAGASMTPAVEKVPTRKAKRA
ncbi:MAG: restriction endonuclease [Myxococcales bacterium 68-20]|nr:MAG: restriction endonuclease [Myxococcales bacterium 68-20]